MKQVCGAVTEVRLILTRLLALFSLHSASKDKDSAKALSQDPAMNVTGVWAGMLQEGGQSQRWPRESARYQSRNIRAGKTLRKHTAILQMASISESSNIEENIDKILWNAYLYIFLKLFKLH